MTVRAGPQRAELTSGAPPLAPTLKVLARARPHPGWGSLPPPSAFDDSGRFHTRPCRVGFETAIRPATGPRSRRGRLRAMAVISSQVERESDEFTRRRDLME